jgi:hypothetical protein
LAAGLGLIANSGFCQTAIHQSFISNNLADVRRLGMSMDNSIAFSDKALAIDLDQYGEWIASAAVSALGVSQTNTTPGYPSTTADLSNAQLVLQKNTGVAQFYFKAGSYSFPELGTPYKRASFYTNDTYGYVPQIYAAYVPNSNWSALIGKLQSMGGYEANFTYQNLNIARGLLWGQTNNISRGIQVNHKQANINLAFTLNDGSYSGKYNWLGASASYRPSLNHHLGISYVGPISPNNTNTFNTPLLQNNSQIGNVVYKFSSDHWHVVPYLQYSFIPANSSIGIPVSYTTRGGAILVNYKMRPTEMGAAKLKNISLPVRVEYLSTNGGNVAGAPILLYGPNSSAWTFTITPTYQFEQYFMRFEASLVKAVNASAGASFGANGTNTSQVRGMVELGILY